MKPRRGRQTGAALLALVFVVVAASTYLLVLKLNAATRPYQREQQSVSVLQEAKQALIAYAVSFPDLSGTIDETAGPGYLPCPDTDNDGSPESFAWNCDDEVGRFPGEFLHVTDYEDGSGERLWYSVADNFRNIANKHKPMNSDTQGQLSVDSITDVVAVIMAPGPPTETQVGRPSLTVTEYLEGENADGDTNFSSNAGNDRLVYITRQELMQAIEKRVLGDVAHTLNTYRSEYGGFPWLSTFAKSDNSPFRSTIGEEKGHLPFHWADDDSTVPGVNPFSTSIQVSWNLDAGTAGITITPDPPATGVPTLTVTCVENLDCNDPNFGVLSSIPVTTVNCSWVDKETFACDGFSYLRVAPCDLGCGTWWCLRRYDVDIPDFTGDVTVTGPSATSTRTRRVSITNGSLPDGNNVLRVQDYYFGNTPISSCSVFTFVVNQATNYITFDSSVSTVTGSLSISGIKYDLDVDAGELPEWFVKNRWQDLIYVAYPSVETVPGGAATACIVGTNCLTLNGVPPINNNKRAIVMAAGSVLPTNLSRPNASRNAYFEGENAEPANEIFEKTAQSATSNDQIRVLATSP